MLKRILIVDDNTEHLEVLKETLSYFNFLIQTKCDGKELLEVVENFNPDLLLLDYILPGDNGVDLCQKVKSNPETSDIPVILMSGYLGILEQFTCCNGFLYKPLDLDLLLEKIDDLIGDKIPVFG